MSTLLHTCVRCGRRWTCDGCSYPGVEMSECEGCAHLPFVAPRTPDAELERLRAWLKSARLTLERIAGWDTCGLGGSRRCGGDTCVSCVAHAALDALSEP